MKARSGEILRLRWSEVTKSRLRLSQTKTGPRDVLLSEAASQILKELRTGRTSSYVFPAARNPDRPRSTRRYTHLDGSTLAKAADKVAREIEKMMEGG